VAVEALDPAEEDLAVVEKDGLVRRHKLDGRGASKGRFFTPLQKDRKKEQTAIYKPRLLETRSLHRYPYLIFLMYK
jgi:hypothetical protein